MKQDQYIAKVGTGKTVIFLKSASHLRLKERGAKGNYLKSAFTGIQYATFLLPEIILCEIVKPLASNILITSVSLFDGTWFVIKSVSVTLFNGLAGQLEATSDVEDLKFQIDDDGEMIELD